MTSTRTVSPTLCRCPACGHQLPTPAPTRCPLCSLDFADDRVTGVDVTPYAKAFALKARAWRPMLEWVWFASGERLKHVALIRASAASRRFARQSILLWGLGMGLVQTTQIGWRHVTAMPAIEPTGSLTPAGFGWLHVAAAPRPLRPALPAENLVDLWWSPLQGFVALVTAALAAWILMWLTSILLRVGVTLAHHRRYRGEQRMTAAIHYSMAWLVPVFLGTLAAALRPLAFVGTMNQWAWYPADRIFLLAAAVLSVLGAAMWWFWLIRLGATAPARTRVRVSAFFGLGPPVIVALAAAGWWYGLGRMYDPLFDLLRVTF